MKPTIANIALVFIAMINLIFGLSIIGMLADIKEIASEMRPTVTEVHEYHYPAAEFVTVEADRVRVEK